MENTNQKRLSCFLENYIFIGYVKLSHFRREFIASKMFEQTVVKVCLSLRETFSNSIAFIFINKYLKGALHQISIVFATDSHVACYRVF